MGMNDMFNTIVTFVVWKKVKMQTLKTITAGDVASKLYNKEDIRKLEIPLTLFTDLEEAFEDSWRKKSSLVSLQKRETQMTISIMALVSMDRANVCPYCDQKTGTLRLLAHIANSRSCFLKYQNVLDTKVYLPTLDNRYA